MNKWFLPWLELAHFQNYQVFCEKMTLAIESWGTPSKVISGGARGADSLAKRWCEEHGVEIEELIPNWKGPLGKRAGLARNTDIIAKSTHLLAFPSKTGSGTQDTIRKAEQKGIPAIIYWTE